jgi:hypothetical protein
MVAATIVAMYAFRGLHSGRKASSNRKNGKVKR